MVDPIWNLYTFGNFRQEIGSTLKHSSTFANTMGKIGQAMQVITIKRLVEEERKQKIEEKVLS